MIRLLLQFLIRLLWKIDNRLHRRANVATPDEIHADGRKLSIMATEHRERCLPRFDVHFLKTLAGARPIERPVGILSERTYKKGEILPGACPAVHIANRLGLIFTLPFSVTFNHDRTFEVEYTPTGSDSPSVMGDLVRELGPAYILNLGYRIAAEHRPDVDLYFVAPARFDLPGVTIWEGVMENPARAHWVGKGDVIQAVIQIDHENYPTLRLESGTPLLRTIPLQQYDLNPVEWGDARNSLGSGEPHLHRSSSGDVEGPKD